MSSQRLQEGAANEKTFAGRSPQTQNRTQSQADLEKDATHPYSEILNLVTNSKTARKTWKCDLRPRRQREIESLRPVWYYRSHLLVTGLSKVLAPLVL